MPSFFGPGNWNGNEVQNVKAQNLGSAPTALGSGQFYYDTGLSIVQYYNGTAWINPQARANHTGTQLANTISNLASTVQGYSLSGFAAPAANIPMAGFTLTGLPAPTAAGQPAEYAWTIGQIQASAAGIASKPSVVAVSTANIATLSGLPTVDGIVLTAGQRLLLTGQTTATQNGPYAVAAGAWTRANTDGQSELETGAIWFVESGTTYAKTQWVVATAGTITVGTTSVAINQFGGASSYAAGNGLSLTGSTFAVVAGAGIIADGTSTRVDTTVVARKYQTTFTTNGSANSWTITHSLGNQYPMVFVTNTSTGDQAFFTLSGQTTTALTLGATTTPTTGTTYSVLVIG